MDTDADLVMRARAGDRSAFETLVLRHETMLRAMCLRMAGRSGLAEDAAHEAVLQAMLGLHLLRQPERFGAWLAGIGLNMCRRMLRKEYSTWSPVDLSGGERGVWPADEMDPQDVAEQSELAQAVRDAVMALPPGQRAATLLYYLAGLTQAEVAETLGVEVGAVKARLFKARRSLQRELAAVWKERYMEVAQAVEVEVADVRTSNEGEEARYMVLLRERGGNRGFPIWIGASEGLAVAVLLEGEPWPRPMTYALAVAAIEALGGRVTGAHIGRLASDVFYASLVLSGGEGDTRLDARPSDAVALALAMNAPITVEAEVFERIAEEHDDSSWSRKGAAEVVAAVRERAQARNRPPPPPE